MTEVLDRESRVRIAAGGLALAYLRLLSEGDSLRASLVLAEFQNYWSTTAGPIVAGDMDPLSQSGAYDEATRQPLYSALDAISVTGAVNTMPARASGLLSTYSRLLRPSDSNPVWGAYRAALEAAPAESGGAAGAWAFGYGEGLGGDPTDDLVWLDDMVGDEAYEGPLTTIVGTSRSGWRSAYWAMAIGGAALITLGVGLAVRRPRSRRRRR